MNPVRLFPSTNEWFRMIVEALKAYRPETVSPKALVFPNGIPRASHLKVDAKRNGIAYRDGSERYVDFHALGHTWQLSLYLPVRRGGTFRAKIFSSRLLGMATWTQSLYWSFFSNSNTRGAWPLGTRSGTRLRKCSGWARLSSNPSRTNSISERNSWSPNPIGETSRGSRRSRTGSIGPRKTIRSAATPALRGS